MLEPSPDVRRELAAMQIDALRRSAQIAAVGPVRRIMGLGLIRFGLFLARGRVPSLALRPEPEAPAHGGASTAFCSG